MPPSVTPTVVLEAELAGSGGGWTDLSTDVNLEVEPITFDYGIKGGGPLDRIASTGTMTWAMNNSARNSGGLLGYYTPGHANARSGWELGIIVRLKITDPATSTVYYKFRGTLDTVTPDAGITRRRAVHCVALDWIYEASECLLRDMAVQLNKRSDEIINTIVTASHHRQPAATSFNVGQSTFSFALDNVRDESTVGLRGLADVTLAEGGYLYMKGDTVQGGTLKFEDRHARPKAASSATFNATMFDINAVRSRRDILNRSNVIVHPRKVDAAATTVLWELTPTETKPSILPGETLVFSGLYRESTGRFVRIGGDAIVTPVATTDYTGNAAADGSGADLTGSLALAFASTGNSASFAFTNNHVSAIIYLTKVQVRGKAVQDRYELTVFSKNTTSSNEFSEHDFTYDMIFEDSVAKAKGFADWMINLYGDARTVVSSMTLKANHSAALLTQALAREPGDKITITESMTGISSVAYFINGVIGTYRKGGLFDVSWVLAPSDQQSFWILEDAVAGLLETSTVLGFI